VQARLAEMRRNLLPTTTAPKQAKPIRPSTLAKQRDELIELIGAITGRMGGAVQFAHRHLSGLSLNDLRRVYDALTPDITE
jgi:hypothetical protein